MVLTQDPPTPDHFDFLNLIGFKELMKPSEYQRGHQDWGPNLEPSFIIPSYLKLT